MSVSEDITDKNGNTITVTVGFHDCHCGCGASIPCEIFVTKRTKTGTAFDKLLYKLGLFASRIMQGNNQQ